MGIQNYAVLDSLNNVLNVMRWDGLSTLNLAGGQTSRPTPAGDGSVAQTGGTFNGTSFVAPVAGVGTPPPVVPTPATTPPPAVTAATPYLGTQTGVFALSDHSHPSSVQRKRITVGSSGQAIWTFGTAYTQVPVVSATAENPTGSQPITVDIVSVTLTAATFKVWQAQTTAINLAGVTAGLNLSPFQSAASGIVIDAIAALPTA